MGRLLLAFALGASPADDPAGPVNPPTPSRRPAPRGEPGSWGWMADPRSAVLLTLVTALVLGGGRRLYKGMQARRASARLAEPDVTEAEILEAARHGREGLIDLFRLLGTATDAARRDAAGRAIAALWREDNLIAEEEKALVRRGYSVDWKARRRYPRDLTAPIRVVVEYGVPFLRDAEGEVGPAKLAWSHRILGTERASLEEFSPWTQGRGRAAFAVDPADFATNGPHRLVLHAKVRTVGLTESWELDLPHVPFNFELDPALRVDSLLTLPDDARGEAIGRSVALDPAVGDADSASRFVPLTDALVLRDPPSLVVRMPLPCDLAHRAEVEFEGVPGRFPAGEVILSGQVPGGAGPARSYPIAAEIPPGSCPIERPGEVRLRVVLTADPHRGWADPDVRSVWPGTITTGWASARVSWR